MGAEVCLKSASRETLLEAIASWQAIITELRCRVKDLERRVSSRGPSAGMPSNKPTPSGTVIGAGIGGQASVVSAFRL